LRCGRSGLPDGPPRRFGPSPIHEGVSPMPRARIGKLFHLTPLVDDLGKAEYFFNTVFSPLCMMRNYSEHWHRHAAIYVIGETSIEPMQCLAPEPGQEAT